MNIILRRILLLLPLLFTFLFLRAAEDYTTQGREFWLSFYNQDDESPDETASLFVLVSCQRGCTGIITNPNTGWGMNFSVLPNEVKRLEIPATQALMHSTYDTAYVANCGLLLQTSDTASVYLGNFRQYSFDASVVLPTPCLSDEYIAASYRSSDQTAILIVATQDGTNIDITPSNDITYAIAPGDTVTMYRKQTYSRTLNRGETYLLAAPSLLGTHIKSSDCKPIAVFSGNYCPYVPSDCMACDVLTEQMPPLNAWGKHFVIVPLLERERDSRISILPSANNTIVTIKQNGKSQSIQFGLGQFIELEIGTNDIAISASSPISVTQYAIGNSCSKSGDPMMIWVNPTEQSVTSTLFSPCPSPQITAHYALVVTPTATSSQTTLDGVNVGDQFAICSQDPEFSFARLKVDIATHALKNPSGMMVYAYGLSGGEDKTQQFESYGYYCGARLRNVRDEVATNNVDAQYFSTEDVSLLITVGSPDMQSIDISINNTHRATLAPASTSYTFSALDLQEGTNKVDVTFHRKCLDDTQSLSICRIVSGQSLSATICNGDSYDFHGSSYASSGHYETVIPSPTSCDTLVSLNLHVLDPIVTYQTIPLFWGDTCYVGSHSYFKKGTYEDHFTSSFGCDSTVITTIERKYTNCPDIIIPSFFTPNGDGENDQWSPLNIDCYDNAEIRIYDRYAKLLCKMITPQATRRGWNGMYEGKPVPSSTYWYEIKLPEIHKQFVGCFLLKR